MTKKKDMSYAQQRTEKEIKLRNQFWPEVKEDELWLRTDKENTKGFTTIPRGMPQISQAMDYCSKNKPLSAVYFALWCRVYDSGVVTIENQRDLAYESGFSGQRAESTWVSRMKRLVELGFVEIHKKPSGDIDFVLIKNPYKVIKRLYADKEISQAIYDALYIRAEQVGATDLD